MNEFFLPYDVFERHKKVGSFINASDIVLDVGGQLKQLSNFCKPQKIVVANIKESQEQADVIIEKSNLPFKNNSFSAVCAIDVLEHIPKGQRTAFLKELVRVAKKTIILSFPIGTERHKQQESEIYRWLKDRRRDVTYLKEHVRYGLPTREEIAKLAQGTNYKLFYSGDLIINKILFKIFMFDPRIKFLRQAIFKIKLLFNLLTNQILYVILSNKSYSGRVVRAYLIIKQ